MPTWTLGSRPVRGGIAEVEYKPVGEGDSECDSGEETKSSWVDESETEARSTMMRLRATVLRALGVFTWLVGLLAVLPWWLQAILPSFLHGGDKKGSQRLHPSAWLDGLRGIAALFVVCHHATLLYFPWYILGGWGHAGTHHIIQLPLLRLLVSGPPQVMVFFVVSGYAISYKPLKLMRQRQEGSLLETLASSAFRRHARLFLPLTIVTLGTAIATWAGFFGGPNDGWQTFGSAIPSRQPEKFSSLWAQLRHYFWSVAALITPFDLNLWRGLYYIYDPNLWTLPIEFECSLVVFAWLLAFARARDLVRMIAQGGVFVYCLWFKFYEISLFLGGCFLADLHFQLDGTDGSSPAESAASSQHYSQSQSALGDNPCGDPEGGQESPVMPRPCRRRFTFGPIPRQVLCISLFIFAWHVLAVPPMNLSASTTPGFVSIIRLTPRQYDGEQDQFWRSVGAVALVFAIDRSGPKFLQLLFTNRFSQYWGKISYALYLVHGPLLWTYGYRLAMYFFMKPEFLLYRNMTLPHGAGYGVGMLKVVLCFAPVLIWAADLTSRFIDAQSVSFIKGLYNRIVVVR